METTLTADEHRKRIKKYKKNLFKTNSVIKQNNQSSSEIKQIILSKTYKENTSTNKND